MLKSSWVRGVLGLATFSFMIGTALATVLSTIGNVEIPGVDSNGSPSTSLSGTGVGKYYKESRTGIIVGSFQSYVTNNSASSAMFQNQGVSFTDPFTSISSTSTTDLEVVSPPVSTYAKAALFLIYNPTKAVP